MELLEFQRQDYSEQEYFDLLETSQEKLEYTKGKIIAMAGGTGNHNRIKLDTTIYIGSRIKKYRPYDSDMAIAIRKEQSYFFPDLSFVCDDKDEFEGDNQLRLLNPSVIIEVLSPGTENRDRGAKFHIYWHIPSMKEYVLIDSRSTRVDVYNRQGDGQWLMRSYIRLDQSVKIEALGLEVPMAEIYKRAEF